MTALAGRVASVLLRECRRRRDRGQQCEDGPAKIDHLFCSL
jgi:hypothetical protein